MPSPDLPTLTLATGALGTAAFGLVEALKWTRPVGLAGFPTFWARLGALTLTLETAHGPTTRETIEDRYRGDTAELTRMLRQGVRVGLTPDNAERVAAFLGTINGPALRAVLEKRGAAQPVTDAERAILARYELAADARIDAALTVAQVRYTGTARVIAMFASLAMALIAFLAMDEPKPHWSWALIIGVAAVPIAPIAKDLASGLNSAARALKARG